MRIRCTSLIAGLSALIVNASVTGQDLRFPPVEDLRIARYTAYRTDISPEIDGRLDEPMWVNARRTDAFVDLISGEATIHDTRAAILWDDEFLYVGFWVEEPLVTARYTERDDPIYYDNDVEIFIAGSDAYYEFEMNALGTIYEGLFIWQESYVEKGYSAIPELDIEREGTTFQSFNGVGFKDHPRGERWAFLKWDFPGMRTAVHVDGTLNDDSDRDRGWTVELAFPWEGMRVLAMGDHRAMPPRDGDVWRINCSRFNQYREAAPAEDSSGWAWTPHMVWDSHIPECFPYVTFSESTTPESSGGEPR